MCTKSAFRVFPRSHFLPAALAFSPDLHIHLILTACNQGAASSTSACNAVRRCVPSRPRRWPVAVPQADREAAAGAQGKHCHDHHGTPHGIPTQLAARPGSDGERPAWRASPAWPGESEKPHPRRVVVVVPPGGDQERAMRSATLSPHPRSHSLLAPRSAAMSRPRASTTSSRRRRSSSTSRRPTSWRSPTSAPSPTRPSTTSTRPSSPRRSSRSSRLRCALRHGL